MMRLSAEAKGGFSVQRYLWPIASGLVTTFLGTALLVAPFALHLAHGSWGSATETLFWSGIGVIVLGLGSALLWQRDLSSEIRAVLQPAGEEVQPTEEPEGNDVPEEDFESQLTRLAAAVLQDLKAESGGGQGASAERTPATTDDLQAVASAILRDLSEQHGEPAGHANRGRGGMYS